MIRSRLLSAGILLGVLITTQVSATPLVFVLSELSGPEAVGPGVISIVDVDNAFAVTQAVTGLDGVQTLAFSPDLKTVYVSDRFASVVYVIDSASLTITASIPVSNDGELALSPDGMTGYINDTDGGLIHVLDLVNNTLSGSITVSGFPFFLAVSPDGATLYASLSFSVAVIDTATKAVTATIPVGASPQDLVVTPDGAKVYTTIFGDDVVVVIDAGEQTLTGSIAVGDGPVGAVLTPDGSKVYVVNFDSSSVSVIDTGTDAVTATIDLGVAKEPVQVVITPDGSTVFVLNAFCGVGDCHTEVAVIDVATDTLTTTLAIPNAWSSFGIGIIDRGFTETGSDVSVSPIAPSIEDVTLTFSSVTASGDTSLSVVSPPPAVPEGFKLSSDELAFDISTTATFTGTVTVCVTYTSDVDEESLQFLHEEAGVFVDVTTSLDTVNNIICGGVTSFSTFLVVVPLFGLSEQLVIRGTGKPVQEVIPFFSASGEAKLILKTGSFVGEEFTAVSSATVTLNGEVVFGPHDFSKQSALLEVPIALLAGENVLEATVNGEPGSALTLKIVE